MSCFDVSFSFDAGQRDLFGGDALSVFYVTLLRFVDNDALKLFFLIEEIRHIKKRVTFEPDVNKS